MPQRKRPEAVLLAVLILGMSVLGCKKEPPPPQPTKIAIAAIPETRAGLSVDLSAEVFDQNNQPMPNHAVKWAIDPPEQARLDGTKLQLLKEGATSIAATAGAATAKVELEILSELTGEWERTTQPRKGMRVKIGIVGDNLVGTITRPPPVTDKAVEWIRKTWRWSKTKAKKAAECETKVWATGLRKMRKLKRTDDGTWAGEHLSKGFAIRNCSESNVSYNEFEVTLKEGVMNIAGVTSRDQKRGNIQKWTRVDID